MNKKILFALSFVFALIGFSGCSENVAEEEYENWRPRNEHFIDSIASLARSGKDGWEMIKSYNLSDSLGKNGQNIYYIYVQKLEKGAGTTYPEYNDSVRVHYLGRLLPSKSYASLGIVPVGTQVNISDYNYYENEWLAVVYNGQTGYIKTEFIEQ